MYIVIVISYIHKDHPITEPLLHLQVQAIPQTEDIVMGTGMFEFNNYQMKKMLENTNIFSMPFLNVLLDKTLQK